MPFVFARWMVRKEAPAKDKALLEPAIQSDLAAWEKRVGYEAVDWQVLDPGSFQSSGGATLTKQADHSVHFSYEMVALTPRTCAALGIALSEEDSRRPYVEMSGRKGLGVDL